MDEAHDVSIGFFGARGDSTNMFAAVDKAFDAVAAAYRKVLELNPGNQRA